MGNERYPIREEVYKDLLQPAVKELGDILKNSVKVARFAFAGIDFLAAQQDRWQQFLQHVASKADEKNLTDAHAQIADPVIEGMMYVEQGTLTEEMFANLLARSVDRQTQDQAHPAFPQIIQQLSHDEAVILFLLKKRSYTLRRQCDLQGSRIVNMRTVREDIPVQHLTFREHLWMYMVHLYSLTVAGTWKTENDEPVLGPNRIQLGGITHEERKLTDFGKLFAKACIPDRFEGLAD
jgi:hypothetical protein